MIIEQQNILFSKWQEKRKYNDFIKDGVFCEEEYVKQPLKILYVLKEANWNGSVNLCEWILSEPKSGYWRTWNNIARWTKALIEGGEYPHYVSKTDKSYWVKKIAFLNLKKVGGGAKANKDEISEYAIRDKKFIKEQILLYNPDVIICCGRGQGKNADLLYNEVLTDLNRSEWKKPIKTYNWFTFEINNKDIPVISFVHPQMWGGHDRFKEKYNDILDIKANLSL